MSSQPFHPDADDAYSQYHGRSPYIPNNTAAISTDSHEVKASYDDLIDEYASPYTASARHGTFNVETQHRRAASLTKKSYADVDTAAAGYPPGPSGPEPPAEPLWKRILPDSVACRLYVFTVLVETAIDLAVEAELLLHVHSATEQIESATGQNLGSADTKKMSVYLSIFVLAHVFQFAMAVDAVAARNTLQFISLTAFNTVFLAYSVIQIGEVKETLSNIVTDTGTGLSDIPINVLTTITPCVVGAAELIFILLGWKIYHEFGWKVYKFLGADRRIKKMYASYQIYDCLIKFDVFFWAGFSVQFIVLVLNTNDWEFYVTCAALPLSLVLLVEGHLAARHENKWMMATFMSGCVGAMIYFVYKLTKVLMYRNTEFQFVWRSLTVFSIIAIVFLLATFVYSVIVMRNFGRGLKDALIRKDEVHQRFGSTTQHNRMASANPNRMSID